MSTTSESKNMKQVEELVTNDFTHLKCETAHWMKRDGVWVYRGFGQTEYVAADSEEYKKLYGDE